MLLTTKKKVIQIKNIFLLQSMLESDSTQTQVLKIIF